IALVRDPSQISRQISNSAAQLQNLGASVPEYFLPYGRHPIFGAITRNYPNSGNFPEQTLFFGYSTMLLAVVGLVFLLRRGSWLSSDPWRRSAAVFAAVLIPSAFLFSLKSHVHLVGLYLPMPSSATAHITTLWRVYARFGLLVGLGLAVLAALALS